MSDTDVDVAVRRFTVYGWARRWSLKGGTALYTFQKPRRRLAEGDEEPSAVDVDDVGYLLDQDADRLMALVRSVANCRGKVLDPGKPTQRVQLSPKATAAFVAVAYTQPTGKAGKVGPRRKRRATRTLPAADVPIPAPTATSTTGRPAERWARLKERSRDEVRRSRRLAELFEERAKGLERMEAVDAEIAGLVDVAT